VERLLAPAKVTLELRVTGRRADGYHLIDAEMVSVDLCDSLEIGPGDELEVVGAHAVETGTDNLVRRALALVERRASVLLHKQIPTGAGLGGGSSDAAAILRWAGFDDIEAAATLGADVPFCLRGGRARVRGIGEQLESLPFEERELTLITPPFGCDTGAVYERWDELGGPSGDGINDLEPAALALEPRLAEWRDRLAEATGLSPTLAGSGSTWFVPGPHPGPGRRVVRTVPAVE